MIKKYDDVYYHRGRIFYTVEQAKTTAEHEDQLLAGLENILLEPVIDKCIELLKQYGYEERDDT